MESKCFISLYFHFSNQFPTPPAFYALHAFCCMLAQNLSYDQGQAYASQAFIINIPSPIHVGSPINIQSICLHVQNN